MTGVEVLKNDCRRFESSTESAGRDLAEAKAEHRQKSDRPIEKQVQYLNFRS